MLLWTKVCKYEFLFSNLLSIYLRVEFRSYMVILCLNFWGIKTVFHSSCTVLCSHQQCTNVLISPHHQLHLQFKVCLVGCCCCCFFFFTIAIQVGVKRYLPVVLLRSSLMNNTIDNLFMCLLAICLYLEKCLFKFFAHFFILVSFLNCDFSNWVLWTHSNGRKASSFGLNFLWRTQAFELQ